jgi:hypothetical protein
MLLTPTFIGSLLAGVACWLLFWYGISHVDSIPYLNQYLSRKMILEWIRKNPQLALMLTELVNIGLHGVGSAAAVLFTFGGTLVNAAMIFGVVPVQGLISKSLAQLKDLRNKEVA